VNMRRPTPRNGLGLVRWTATGIFAIAVGLFAGCDFPGKPNPADRPVPPEDVLIFSEIYKRNCAGCHGADGESGPAPPLNDSLFRALVPEGELERVVSAGRQGTPMPGFARTNGGTLTPAQVQVLVRGIKGIPNNSHEGKAHAKGGAEQAGVGESISAAWGAPKPSPKNAPLYLLSKHASTHTSGEYEQIRKTVFARACAGCHGEQGKGDSGGGAINDPSFLALASDQGLRRLVITGRPDLGMPDYAGTDGRDPDFRPLTPSEVDDLVDLLASWRTSGAAETDNQRQTASR
jgi:cytochrome c oxidase cbb3-type subunit III